MTKDELISKQQLEIEELKQKKITNEDLLRSLHGMMFSIGQPLNDNVLQMNVKQLVWVSQVNSLIKSIEP